MGGSRDLGSIEEALSCSSVSSWVAGRAARRAPGMQKSSHSCALRESIQNVFWPSKKPTTHLFSPPFSLSSYLNWFLKGYFEDLGKRSSIKMWSAIRFLPRESFSYKMALFCRASSKGSPPPVPFLCPKPLQLVPVLRSVTGPSFPPRYRAALSLSAPWDPLL